MDRRELASAPLFDGMPDDEMGEIAGLFTEVHVRSGDSVTDEDQYGATFFVVLEGRVRVKVENEPVNELGPGDHFGEVALVTGQRRNATVKAIDTCRLAKMMNWDFASLLDRNAILAERIRSAADARAND